MLTLGDNTNAPVDVLTKQILLCCGEDPNELVQVLSSELGCRIRELHSYRCYRFWKCMPPTHNAGEIALVWSGIGTGCIEPLLYEMLFERHVVSEIILIGTAGKIGGAGEGHSAVAHAIVAAHMGPTALCALGKIGMLRPTLDVKAPPAIIVSTDFYYLWNATAIDQWPRSSEYQDAWREAALIDMEVAQFYWLCDRFGGGAVRYAAIKGAANLLGVAGMQVTNSRAVLTSCARSALETFQVVVERGKK